MKFSTKIFSLVLVVLVRTMLNDCCTSCGTPFCEFESQCCGIRVYNSSFTDCFACDIGENCCIALGEENSTRTCCKSTEFCNEVTGICEDSIFYFQWYDGLILTIIGFVFIFAIPFGVFIFACVIGYIVYKRWSGRIVHTESSLSKVRSFNDSNDDALNLTALLLNEKKKMKSWMVKVAEFVKQKEQVEEIRKQKIEQDKKERLKLLSVESSELLKISTSTVSYDGNVGINKIEISKPLEGESNLKMKGKEMKDEKGLSAIKSVDGGFFVTNMKVKSFPSMGSMNSETELKNIEKKSEMKTKK